MNFSLWNSGGSAEENRFADVSSQLDRHQEIIEEQEIDLDAVREFGSSALDIESGDSFKGRETHNNFEGSKSDSLEEYKRSGLLAEMDLGDYNNFYFVTDRGEFAINNVDEITEQSQIYETLLEEDRDSFGQLAETDEKIGDSPATKGDTEEDYTVKQDKGGLISGGWERRLTEKGAEVKSTIEEYNPEIIEKLVQADPIPDQMDIVKTILVDGNSDIDSRLKLAEGFMSQRRQAYEKQMGGQIGFEECGQFAEKMLDEWEKVYGWLGDRQERMESESGRLEDKGVKYRRKLEERMEDLDKTLNYLDFDNPHESDVEKIKDKVKDLEKIYWQETRY